MPSKKKKYNARFPAGRIKKIMQSDEEIGKVAQAVPVIISRTLELFVESLLTKTLKITNARNAKTLSTSHMKQCIMSEQRFDFLRELVKNIPDISVAEDEAQSSPEEQYPDSDTPYDLSMPSTSTQATSHQQQQRNTNGAGSDTYRLRSVNNGGNAVNYNKRPASSMLNTGTPAVAAGSSTVIMHTTSLANAANRNTNDYLPPKLARSDSTPAQMQSLTLSKPIWRPMDASPTTSRKRLKQQSQSLSYTHNNNNNNNDSSSSNLPKQSITHEQHVLGGASQKLQPAIPAPIVNFDFCTKPIVKIDYSNLPMTANACGAAIAAAAGVAAPLSAPVLGQRSDDNINNSGSAFNFSTAAPIINIDLSDLVRTTTTPGGAQTPVINGPAVATISIGALPLIPTPKTPLSTPTGLEKSGIAATAAAATSTSGLTAATKSNALFELDEDYDNI